MKLAIETIIKHAKQSKVNKFVANNEIDQVKIIIDLEKLVIRLNGIPIDLITKPCHYGGYRYYYKCLQCSRSVRYIYTNNMLCGTCLGVHNNTLNRSKKDCGYYTDLAIKTLQKIEPSWYPDDYIHLRPLPSRPKRMKREKYWRLINKALKYNNKATELWLESVNKAFKK